MSRTEPKREYVLGRSPHEHRRLSTQGGLVARLTRHVFEAAGVSSGMRVLDIGCGVGDVALLAAQMVGPKGSVVALDVDEIAIARGRERARKADVENICFEAADFNDYCREGQFDALVGRLVLLYQPDPVASLRATLRNVRPGGVIAFQEAWFTPLPLDRQHLLFARVVGWIIETLRRSGAHVNLGYEMFHIFQAAGLPKAAMSFEMVVDGDPDSPICQYTVDSLRSVLPKVIEYGIATAEEVGIDNLADRVREEVRKTKMTYMVLPLFGAWCRK